jgi:1-acyl-sn-glycerol-3-phosphate acyltransferase
MLVCFLTDVFVRNKRRKLIYLSKITSTVSKIGLKLLGVKVDVKNYENLSKSDKNCLIISNHLSYVDIFMISSLIPSIFIANSELKEEFLLGKVTRFSGGVFVERRNRTNLLEEIEKISNLLKEGFNVVLFPEGTTSNGERVLPFKTSFLDSAIRSNVDILLVCIKYRKINDEDVNPKNRDLVFYHGGMKFFEHFFKLLSLKSVNVELTFIERIAANSYLSRKELAKLAFDTINSAYQEVSSKEVFANPSSTLKELEQTRYN